MDLNIPCIVSDGVSLQKCHSDEDVIEELVLALVQLVPIGKVTTYSSIARLLHIHPRTVALMLKRNRKPVIYPCHRVVRSDGTIGGYTLCGRRMDNMKRILLTFEGVSISGDRVSPQHVMNLAEQFLESG